MFCVCYQPITPLNSCKCKQNCWSLSLDILCKRDNIESIVYSSWRMFHRRSLKWIAIFFRRLTKNLCASNFIHCSGYFYLFWFFFIYKWFLLATNAKRINNSLEVVINGCCMTHYRCCVAICLDRNNEKKFLLRSTYWKSLQFETENCQWRMEDGRPASVRFQQFFRFNRYQMNNKIFAVDLFFLLCVYSIFIVFVAKSKFLGTKFIEWKSVSRSFCAAVNDKASMNITFEKNPSIVWRFFFF